MITQEQELKGSLSRFGSKASEMVLELEDFTHPSLVSNSEKMKISKDNSNINNRETDTEPSKEVTYSDKINTSNISEESSRVEKPIENKLQHSDNDRITLTTDINEISSNPGLDPELLFPIDQNASQVSSNHFTSTINENRQKSTHLTIEESNFDVSITKEKENMNPGNPIDKEHNDSSSVLQAFEKDLALNETVIEK